MSSDCDNLPEGYEMGSHPMEDVLDIESGTTEFPLTVHRATDIITTDEMDIKDTEIDEQFQEVYDAAIGAFEQQSMDTELIEPKYRARNHEVAVQYLNAALNAAKEKSSMKAHKDKLSIAKGKLNSGGTTNNNLIIADRNDILKHLGAKDESE